jgi:hypothetical protein
MRVCALHTEFYMVNGKEGINLYLRRQLYTLSCALSRFGPFVLSTRHAVALTLTTIHPMISLSLMLSPTTALAPCPTASRVMRSIAWSRAWYSALVNGLDSPHGPARLLAMLLRKDFGSLRAQVIVPWTLPTTCVTV